MLEQQTGKRRCTRTIIAKLPPPRLPDRSNAHPCRKLTELEHREHLGVGFVSLTEALDLTTPAGRAMAGLLATFVGRFTSLPSFLRPLLPDLLRSDCRYRIKWPSAF